MEAQGCSYLGELVECGVGGVVSDEEPHGLVVNLDCSGAVHVGETALKTITIKILLQNESDFWLRSQQRLLGELRIHKGQNK